MRVASSPAPAHRPGSSGPQSLTGRSHETSAWETFYSPTTNSGLLVCDLNSAGDGLIPEPGQSLLGKYSVCFHDHGLERGPL